MADPASSRYATASERPITTGTPFYGFYWIFFGIVEPILTLIGAALAFVDSAQFYHDIVPSVNGAVPRALNHRATILVWQLGNAYFLLALLALFSYNAIPKAVPNNPAAQEPLFAAILSAMAICDVTHIGLTLIGLPTDILLNVDSWNAVTHGNITLVVVLFVVRLGWLNGIGRTTFWGKPQEKVKDI